MDENTNAPNLLFIHSDQHAPNVTGCYGDEVVDTPNLDALATEGALFENAYCASPICVPSRTAMLTGRHPYQNQVWTNEHGLDSSIPTMAHSMGAAGYHPELIGRMHFIGSDQLHGYASRSVGDHSSNVPGGKAVDRGVLEGTAGPQRISLRLSGKGQNAYQVHDEDVTAAAVNSLNRLGVSKRAGTLTKPFSITIGYMLPHPPYVAREEDFQRYMDTVKPPSKPKPFAQEKHPFLQWWRQDTDILSVSDEEVMRARAAYWGMTYRLDAMIGQVLEALRANALDHNTLIVYSTDHGDMLGEHGLWWKHTFYEESVKVPMILSWPGVIHSGQRRKEVITHADMNASILDALGAPPLPNSEGRTFMHLINGSSNHAWENLAFSEYCSDEYAPEGGCYQRMIRLDNWKLIYYHGYPPQLFDLASDPDELTDLAAKPEHSETVKMLTERILQGWNPQEIIDKMAAKKSDHKLLGDWARNIHPAERYRWKLRPEMNRLG